MRRLVPLATMLAMAACIHTRPAAELAAEEAARCELVKAVLREPMPSLHLERLVAEEHGAPAPVLVFFSHPSQGVLERLFANEPECGDERFRVVQDNSRQALLLLLQPEGDGYAYGAERAGPEGLPLQSALQGHVKRWGAGWLAVRP